MIGEGKTKLQETSEAHISFHQTQSGHCLRALGGWRLLLTFCFCALKKVAPGALAVVSCQLLTSKNVHSHSSEALIPFRKTEPQSSNTFM